MKDVELRGMLLAKLYDKRSERDFLPTPSDFSPEIGEQEIVRIARQLHEHGLVKANVSESIGGDPRLYMLHISARGIDVVESGKLPDISIDFMNHQTVNISGSSNVIVGNNNQQTITHSVQELAKIIDASAGTLEEKAEAKGRLRTFLEHPLLAAVAGGAISALASVPT